MLHDDFPRKPKTVESMNIKTTRTDLKLGPREVTPQNTCSDSASCLVTHLDSWGGIGKPHADDGNLVYGTLKTRLVMLVGLN